jgi:hypothetical protein
MAGVIENYPEFGGRAVVRFLQAEGVRSERDLLQVCECPRAERFQTTRKYLCGATNLKMAEGNE